MRKMSSLDKRSNKSIEEQQVEHDMVIESKNSKENQVKFNQLRIFELLKNHKCDLQLEHLVPLPQGQFTLL